jgi:hypothetical protein
MFVTVYMCLLHLTPGQLVPPKGEWGFFNVDAERLDWKWSPVLDLLEQANSVQIKANPLKAVNRVGLPLPPLLCLRLHWSHLCTVDLPFCQLAVDTHQRIEIEKFTKNPALVSLYHQLAVCLRSACCFIFIGVLAHLYVVRSSVSFGLV